MKKYLSIVIALFTMFAVQNLYSQDETPSIKVGIVNGSARYLPKPTYPQEAKDFCADGKVNVEVLISEDGNVISAKAISGDELLHKSAVDAAKKAKFRHTADASPVKVRGIIVYNFVSEIKCIDVGVLNKIAKNIPKPKLKNIVHLRLEKPREVRVQIILDYINGEVLRARVLDGHPLINVALVQSAIQAKFSPVFINGGRAFAKGIIIYKIKPNGDVDTNFETKNTPIIGHLPPNTKPIFAPQPEYPEAARLVGVSGKVTIGILIDEEGNVEEARIVSGHPLLRNSALKAAKQTKFEIQNLSGKPVKVRIIIVYEFKP